MPRTTLLYLLVIFCLRCPLIAGAEEPTNKTLVAWVRLANLDQQGGSALTIQSGEQFDAVVFAERSPKRWMAGSEFFRRTSAEQATHAEENSGPQTSVQIAVVYQNDEIRIYRDGELYASHAAQNINLLHVDTHIAIFGLRHIGAGTGTTLAASIDDARIYAQALQPSEIVALKANQASTIKPFAWWDFSGDELVDRMGRFPLGQLTPGARLSAGWLVLDGSSYAVAARTRQAVQQATRAVNPRAPAPPYTPETPAWPLDPPANWLTYHLAHPGPGDAMPGDPNCIFDFQGRYHLHYIYRNHTGFVFAHVSSDDMVHWKWHPTVLAPPSTGHGMFSGTGFYTKQGRPAIIYHGQGSDRNWIQYPLDDEFNRWSEPVPVEPRTATGDVPDIRHWDPDCWLNGETYYAISGGQNPQLMKSSDLKAWSYLGNLLHDDYPSSLDVPREEDISCANMFQIGDHWMLLCISHTLGCRYYLGDFKNEKYLPNFHAMMSWGSNRFFAPESVLTRDGRRVMWAWVLPGGNTQINGVRLGHSVAPTGVQALPRELDLPTDGILRIRPLRELATLRYNEQQWNQLVLEKDVERAFPEIKGDAFELLVRVAAPLPPEFGVRLLGDAKGHESVQIMAGTGQRTLQIGDIKAPFELQKSEELTLRIFVDKNLVEVFANDRQAAVFAHQHARRNPGVRLFTKGTSAVVQQLRAWRIKPIY